MIHTEHLSDEPATLALGRRLAAKLRPGMVIHLVGDLGAGKTTLVRGMLAGLGFTGRVKSPTFTLVEPYTISKIEFYHFDLYRFRDEQEWSDAGFDDYFHAGSICVIEWPEKAARLVPAPDWVIRLQVEGEGRKCVIETEETRNNRKQE